jgi:PhnB protein
MMSDEFPEMDRLGPDKRGGSTASFMIYVEDVDAAFARAIAAGGTEERAVQDQFYGDRSGTLKDPFGHSWTLSTHVEDVPDEEIQRRMQAMTESMPEPA